MIGSRFFGPAKIRITPAKDQDLEALTALHTQSFWMGWDKGAFFSFLNDTQIVFFVARSRTKSKTRSKNKVQKNKTETMTGFILARFAADEAEILSFVVAPHYRRCGIGSALMHTLLGSLSQKYIANLFLEVDANNKAALVFYQNFGFTKIGRRPNYYQQQKGSSDALVYKYQLTIQN